MSKYYIYQDHFRCIGCYACEVHCKTKNNLPVGPRLSRIIQVGPRLVGKIPRLAFIFMPCFHCETPWCVSACPTGAMQKRQNDGIVYVEQGLCVGCKSCITACPWGVPQWNPETGKVVKCDYCKDRVDRGLKPACVTKCTAHALHFVSPEEASRLKRERFAKEIAEFGTGY
jgi:Fe-S-cluster-containing dehydrogenase component